MQEQPKTASTALMVVFILALAGVVVSGLLTYWHIANVDVPCTNHGCDTVAQSAYSRIWGIPVAAFGLGFYLYGLMTSALLPSLPHRMRSGLLTCLVIFSVAGVLVSAYLTYLELAVIHAICQWCITSAVITMMLLPASIWLKICHPSTDEG